MRTCSVLLDPELAHERRVEGLELTLEGFEDLHIPLLGDCNFCARFFDEDWSKDADQLGCSLIGMSRVAWTVLTGSVEVLHGSIHLEVVHPVLNSAFGWSFSHSN